MTLLLPQSKLSYGTIARNASQSVHPSLHRGMIGGWVPKLGNSGNVQTPDAGPLRSAGIWSAMPEPERWINEDGGWAVNPIASGDKIELTTFPKAGFDQRTFIIRCKPSTTAGPNDLFLWGGASKYFYIYYRTSPRKFSFETNAGTSQELQGGTVVGNGEWCSIACVYDRGAKRIYLNGKLDGSSTNGTTIPATVSDPVLGNEWLGAFSGIYIYNRVLNENEIRLLHQDILAPLYRRPLRYGVSVAAPPAGGFEPWWAEGCTQVIQSGLN